jgi:hypothetical protein
MTRCFLAAQYPILAMSLAISLPLGAQQAVTNPTQPDTSIHTAAEALTLLKGKPLFLRGCWAEDKLEFSSTGTPKDAYQHVPFTLSAFDLKDATLMDNVLQLNGDRVGIEFNKQGKAKRVTLPDQKKKKNPEEITIRIEAPKDGDFSAVLQALFADDFQGIAGDLPEWWKSLANSLQSGVAVPPPPPYSSSTYHVGGSVTEPKVLSYVDPSYTGAARRLKFSGMTDIHLVIDENGLPTNMTVGRPLGLGLDEMAIYAVSQYRFKPATKDGQPVKVAMYVDVNFQIF